MMGLYDMLLPESPYVFYDNDRGYCINTADVLTLIAQLSVTGHWIPCSERLPEERINPNTQDYDWVLCSTTFNDVRAYHFGRGRFLHCADVTPYVIAWQPLPEPYKGDEHGDNNV